MSVPSSNEPSLDSVSTIRDDGSRQYLFPADVTGRFTRARAGAALVLIAIYLLLPWIKIGGYPAVFLDVATRRPIFRVVHGAASRARRATASPSIQRSILR